MTPTLPLLAAGEAFHRENRCCLPGRTPCGVRPGLLFSAVLVMGLPALQQVLGRLWGAADNHGHPQTGRNAKAALGGPSRRIEPPRWKGRPVVVRLSSARQLASACPGKGPARRY